MANNNLKNFKLKIIISSILLLLIPLVVLGFSFSLDMQSVLDVIQSKINYITQQLSILFPDIIKYAPAQLTQQNPAPDFTERAPEGGVPRWWNDRSFHQQQVGFVKPV